MSPSPPLPSGARTIDEAFQGAADLFADREAFVEGDERVSFAAWYDRSLRLAGWWAGRGVRPGDVVAILLPSSFDFAVAFGAAVVLGAVATGINTRLGPNEVGAILARATPAVLVCEVPAATTVPASTSVWGRDEVATASRRQPPTKIGDVGRAADDPAVIIWTSGTTGLPKGAWFDHAGLEAAVRTAGVMTAPFDRRLVSTPFAHAGFMAKLWEQLAWGVTAVVSPTPWSASDMLRLIETERITVAGGVPTQWAKLLEQPGVARADLTTLRIGVSATAPCPPELIERVATVIGCPLVVRYAMTESPSITGTEPSDPPEVQYRTVGRPQDGVEIELRDEEGRPVDAGQTGRIHLRSACAMRGYWNDPAATAAAFDAGGWLRSGDLGHMDDCGNLILDGRADDMYIRGGYNVYPLEVEHVLAEHPAVAEAGVIGVEAPVIGQIGVAFVRPRDHARPPSTEELVTWCKERLADYKAPDRVVLVTEMPLTAMLKLDKQALRNRMPQDG
jgi:acyl-CoA synthetase (AMP-forming)/AMP-acid ligase II